jgi:hypothetical protein
LDSSDPIYKNEKELSECIQYDKMFPMKGVKRVEVQ